MPIENLRFFSDALIENVHEGFRRRRAKSTACSIIGAGMFALIWSAPVTAAPTESAVPVETTIQAARARPAGDGIMRLPVFDLPVSAYLSPEAQAAARKTIADGGSMGSDISKEKMLEVLPRLRSVVREAMKVHVARVTARDPVDVRSEQWGGVPVVVVTPRTGVARRHRNHLLINLHGGAFVLGDADMEGVAEAAPIAVRNAITVVSVGYRKGPEHKFPAASEDVAAVYREALKRYRPQDIGIYGCSAGGVLTGEAIAWFQKEKLPMPAAAGMFCAGGDALYGGDSAYVIAALSGGRIPKPGARMGVVEDLYYGDINFNDPLVSPVFFPDVLKRFPPTLFITATRATELSSVVYTHSRLVSLGVEADLHVWDGLDHGFYADTELPESQEALAVIAKFFENHLGRANRGR